ncbi:restriction endonuclease subunit S [Akkermansia muciniphila]|uniref:restriction endonuclease subunit S n=1 Tax=Akkermansia muciniphila TaxID=239935 RepID=UPI00201DD076|nr:restriction endonuclease subunit S [Akkermansia muciniphila]MCL6677503.1 restriction endonuclease subunit S [Akkermansia muciniphila]
MKYLTLDDVCLLNMGQSPDSSTYNEVGEGLPFYQGNADFGERYPQCRIWCSEPTKIAEKEDVLISVRAPIGALNEAREKCCIGRGLAAIRPKGGLNKDFLYYFLLSKKSYLISKGTGSTFKAISKNVLRELTIPVPTLQEQEKQSGILNTLWRVICKRRTQQAKLDELIKCRFVEMFGDCRSNPKQWDTKKLEEIASVGSSKRVFVEELIDEGIPFYRGTEVGALAEGQNITPELFISASHYQSLCEASGRPVKGDLLMPSICPDGRIWIVDSDTPFYFKDGRVLWVHDIREQFNPVFLQYTLKDRIIADYASIASGTTFAELKIFSLKSCKIFDAPLSLQTTFASFVRRIDKFKFACFFFQLITVLQKIIIFFRNFLICFLF